MLCHNRRAKNGQKPGSSPGHGRTVVHPTDHGEPETAASLFSISCVAEIDRLCWICLGDRLLLLSNVDCSILLHRGNLYWVPGDKEVVRPAPNHPVPRSSQAGSSSSS